MSKPHAEEAGRLRGHGPRHRPQRLCVVTWAAPSRSRTSGSPGPPSARTSGRLSARSLSPVGAPFIVDCAASGRSGRGQDALLQATLIFYETAGKLLRELVDSRRSHSVERSSDRKYTNDHEGRADGRRVDIGITAYAVDQLGDITIVTSSVKEGEPSRRARRSAHRERKTLSDLFAPSRAR